MFILSSLLFSLVTIASHGQGKGGAVSLDLKNASVVDCIRTIEQQTDYTFIFDDSVVSTGTVTFSCSKMPLEDVLRATASKYLLPFAYGNAVKTSSLLC